MKLRKKYSDYCFLISYNALNPKQRQEFQRGLERSVKQTKLELLN